MSPAQCWCCATGDQSLVRVDLGDHPMSVKRFRIYVCENCVTAMAKKIADLKGEVWLSAAEMATHKGQMVTYGEMVGKLERAELKLADLAEFAREL